MNAQEVTQTLALMRAEALKGRSETPIDILDRLAGQARMLGRLYEEMAESLAPGGHPEWDDAAYDMDDSTCRKDAS